ncbi:hypothetical protein Ahy_A07g037367 [Arachis hypogaea]|uniref:Transposase MuDR plant domain-containing protein n=1 Tax=Arachis hypogaea TaxID=3818 RepID=A0A445CIK7_ARAHY|nr:hypothetical protein Ahy_A07g037367 [Arachis hypogaea]
MTSDWSFTQGGPEDDPSNEFEVGQQFKVKEEMMLAVKQYSIRRAMDYRIEESDHLRQMMVDPSIPQLMPATEKLREPLSAAKPTIQPVHVVYVQWPSRNVLQATELTYDLVHLMPLDDSKAKQRAVST